MSDVAGVGTRSVAHEGRPALAEALDARRLLMWPLCVRCARREAGDPAGWYVAPAGVIGAAGAECGNRLVRVG